MSAGKKQKNGLCRTFEKLRNRSGESIAEVLVATLISALAIMGLVLMISSATSLVTSSTELFGWYVRENNRITSGSASPTSSDFAVFKPAKSGEGTLTFTPCRLTDLNISPEISVQMYSNETMGETVTAYKVVEKGE